MVTRNMAWNLRTSFLKRARRMPTAEASDFKCAQPAGATVCRSAAPRFGQMPSDRQERFDSNTRRCGSSRKITNNLRELESQVHLRPPMNETVAVVLEPVREIRPAGHSPG